MNDSQGYKYRGEDVYWLGAAGIKGFSVIQNFNTIKNECLKLGKLFEDPEFPPDSRWLRPKEICQNPTFFVDKTQRFDFKQEDITDCWFMAAVASLTINPNNLSRVVCVDNKFGSDYAGVFHFRFWQNGKWVDVVVDDRLPVNRYNKLSKLSSKQENEFWPALLEKAYAKLYGGYMQLRVGDIHEAFEDFMGSPTEVFDLKQPNKELYGFIKESVNKQSLIACCLKDKIFGNEVVTSEGIIRNRAYIVTKAREVEIDLPPPFNKVALLPLICLRNVWGHTEWNGPWSDGSKEWTVASSQEKAKFGMQIDHDGEFWMHIQDFYMRFDQLSICTERSPNAQIDGSDLVWDCKSFNGEWIVGKTAGGNHGNVGTFHLNPQYTFTLESPDKIDPNALCSVLISLTQKNRRSKEGSRDHKMLGYLIYKVSDEQLKHVPMGQLYFRFTQPAEYTRIYRNPREITGRYQLSPGNYLIVPTSYHNTDEAEFLLRVFYQTSKKNIPEEVDEKEEVKDEEPVDVKEKEPEKEKIPTRRDDMFDPSEKTEIIDNPEWDDVEKLFKNAAGAKEVLDWAELKKILDTTIPQEIFENAAYSDFKTEGFPKETCRSIVAMSDSNFSKTLTLDEFRNFYKEYLKWKEAFKTYDIDENHVIGPFELQDALEAAGYVLDAELVNMLAYRYANDDNEILFGDFILCALKVKHTIESFKKKIKGKDELATFQTDYAIQQSLYC